ncbi:MAG TPA: GDSL-type esterase/lipase family protein [Pirellulales bacterium]|nr:GDSL-type esterase/lipase family protein [Pirellulales bacterium]
MLSVQAPLITDAAPYSSAYVNGVYLDALGRAADPAALDWDVAQLDQGESTQAIAQVVANSPEFATDLVESAYRQYLGRDADPVALTYWVDALKAGFRDEQVIAALVSSDEFYARAGGTDSDWVVAAYQAVLGRPPEASAVEWAVGELSAGVSRDAVAYDLASSSEHEEQVVRDVYSHYLQTTPGAGDLDNWAASLSSGQVTVQSLAGDVMSTNAFYEAQTGVPPTIVPVSGAGAAWTARNEQIATAPDREQAQVVFLGDSITQQWSSVGQSVWAQNYADLNAFNAGIGGDQTQNVLWEIENGDLNGMAPKVVVLMIGINDIGSDDSPQETAEGVAAVVEELQQRLPDTKVLVLGILPAALPGDDLMPNITAANQEIAGLANGQSVFFLDMDPAFLNPDGTINTALHQSELVHLSTAGYVVWAQTMKPELDLLLSLAGGDGVPWSYW